VAKKIVSSSCVDCPFLRFACNCCHGQGHGNWCGIWEDPFENGHLLIIDTNTQKYPPMQCPLRKASRKVCLRFDRPGPMAELHKL
jgi:hypothetical protein